MDDGLRTIPLANPSDIQLKLLGVGDSTNLTATEAYKLVGILRRAVKIRAYAVSHMPYRIMQGGKDATDSDQVKRWNLRRLLKRTETALCVYARAYWGIEFNQFGFNPTPRWLLPPTVIPHISADKGLEYFTRTMPGEDQMPLNRICYIWDDAIDKEIGYDSSDVEAALKAANLIFSIDEQGIMFFQRGAIKMTLIGVEGNPKKEELEKLGNWWKRLVRGIKSAYDTIVVKATIKPQVIGSDLKDTAAPELLSDKKKDVQLTIGVPNSLIESEAANFATAQQDWLMLYTNVATPEFELIAEAANEQFFGPLGYELIPEPKRLEAYLQFLLENAGQRMQAVDVVARVNSGELTRDQGMEALMFVFDMSADQATKLLGRPKLVRVPAAPQGQVIDVTPKTLPAATPQIAAPTTDQAQQAAETAAVQDVALNGAQVTAALDIVAQVSAEVLTYDQGLNALQIMFGMSEEKARRLLGKPEAQRAENPLHEELRRWKRKALRVLAEGGSAVVAFSSDLLNAATIQRIETGLRGATTVQAVGDVFASEFVRTLLPDHGSADVWAELQAARAELQAARADAEAWAEVAGLSAGGGPA